MYESNKDCTAASGDMRNKSSNEGSDRLPVNSAFVVTVLTEASTTPARVGGKDYAPPTICENRVRQQVSTSVECL